VIFVAKQMKHLFTYFVHVNVYRIIGPRLKCGCLPTFVVI